jgi:hypothetical protein
VRHVVERTLVAKLLDEDANFRRVAKCDGTDRELGRFFRGTTVHDHMFSRRGRHFGSASLVAVCFPAA